MKRILLVTVLVSVAATVSLTGDVLASGTIVKYKNESDLGITFDMPARWGKVLETSQSLSGDEGSGAFYLIATTPMPFTAKFMSADYADQYHPSAANVFATANGRALGGQCDRPYAIRHDVMPWSSGGVLSWTCAPITLFGEKTGSSVQSFVVYETGSSGVDLGYYFHVRAFAPYDGAYFGSPSGGEFSLHFENIEKKLDQVARVSSGDTADAVGRSVQRAGEQYLGSVKKMRGFPLRDARAARSFLALVKSYDVISPAAK